MNQCPYVTAIGATQGVENGKTEVTCSSRNYDIVGESSADITSGGGFSNKYSIPTWQRQAISTYFNNVNPKPYQGYNTSGRGYPDLALAAYKYDIVVGGKTTQVSGTSAAVPVFAAMISLINSKRLASGKSALGFINPSLYTRATSFNHDITMGDNCCTSGYICCDQGFAATTGWVSRTSVQLYLTSISKSINNNLLYRTQQLDGDQLALISYRLHYLICKLFLL